MEVKSEYQYNFEMPERSEMGRSRETTIFSLWDSFDNFEKNKVENMYDFKERSACGYPIPEIQRKSVWTTEQSIKFIESAWKGLPLGTYTIHSTDWNDDGRGGVVAKEFSGWLLDGQQRLTAIERYWNNEFPVLGAYWTELSLKHKRHFKSIKFTSYETPLWDFDKINELYYLLSYGGTAHDESQYEK